MNYPLGNGILLSDRADLKVSPDPWEMAAPGLPPASLARCPWSEIAACGRSEPHAPEGRLLRQIAKKRDREGRSGALQVSQAGQGARASETGLFRQERMQVWDRELWPQVGAGSG